MFYINYPNPNVPLLPILISVPHSGTEVPQDILDRFNPAVHDLDDTDWFVHDLYGFAADMGITVLHARFHRWVIDLNRTPDSAPLYTDGRSITELVPTKTFAVQPIYQTGQEPTKEEIQQRLETYYKPYHEQLEKQLSALQQQFSHVLLFEAHSIRQLVPSIQPVAFPDMILGTNDGASAHASIGANALEVLQAGKYKVQYNHPFKGGYITRHFGQPTQKRHAIQLEMTKINYMEDDERTYSPERAKEMQTLLKGLFEKIAETLQSFKA
jgi:N-formylglutamate amidohydrolase